MQSDAGIKFAVDAWHPLEYIAAAARLLEGREKARPDTFRRWKSWLLTGSGGAERVMHALMSSELQTARDDMGKQPVGESFWLPRSWMFIATPGATSDRGGDEKRDEVTFSVRRIRATPVLTLL